MRELSQIRGFGPKRLEALEKRGIATAQDLIERLPTGYRDTTHPLSPAQMTEGKEACFEGFIDGKPALHRARGMQWVSATVADEYGRIRCMWFNQSWMKDRLFDTQHVVLYGRCVRKKSGLFVINPTLEEPGSIIPTYAPVPGVGQKPLRDAVKLLLEEYDLQDELPASFVKRHGLMDRRAALFEAHFPSSFEALARAKERLAFEELLLFQAGVAGEAGTRREAQPLSVEDAWIGEFFETLPFPPTNAQRRVVGEIADDLRRPQAMARMVQGDVGCGKTLIAFCALYLCVRAGGQGALMAPTEILASQHFASAVETLAPLGISCGLVTGRMTAAEKRRAREAIASGEWQVVIGTHALISEDVAFDRLRLVITDEQHRFGVDQRAALSKKAASPHMLVLSATPIPRTLALIIYGDLDVSVIDELPPGRQKVDTFAVGEKYRQRLNAFIRKQVSEGHQVFIVCPLVGEDDHLPDERKAVTAYARKLQSEVFPDLRVAVLHGRMKAKEKESVMAAFAAGDSDILVSTTVVEVGVDVPNANLMVVENAERFGLSQLHQLRGRVGRGSAKSWCVLLSDSDNEDTRRRLKVLTQTNDGFQISEEDLRLRGPGDFFGQRQHGLPTLKAADLSCDMRLLDEAQSAANDLLDGDPALSDPAHALLRRRIDRLFAVNEGGLN